jgi:hypothetical protein
MPNYNPKDMAMMLQMSKKGAMTPQEMALMQNINTAMQPEIAAGNVGMMPPEMQRMAPMPMVQGSGGAVPMPTVDGSGRAVPMPQSQPMNRLAQIQAAANQVLAGGENPEGQRMANIARYFQGR